MTKKDVWIQTFSGIKFYPFRIELESINIIDIAHSLSNTCRFSGHCDFFYSVAEHSCRVYDIVSERAWGLLHDASEAYICDIPGPIKPWIPDYAELEKQIMRKIVERFNLSKKMPCEIKKADKILLATEQRDLMYPTIGDWGPLPEPLKEKIIPWEPGKAYKEFMKRYDEGVYDD